MLRLFYVLFLAFLLSFSASSQSNLPSASTVNLRAEQLQQQINQVQTELKAVHNNPADHDNLVTLSKGLPDLEKRVEDIHQYVAYWGWFSGGAIALFGILITALIIFFSFRITNEAKIAARLAAEEEAGIWFNNKGEVAIQPFLSSLQQQGTDAVANILQAGIDTLKKIETEADQHDKQLTVLENEHRAFLDRMVNPSPSEKGKTLNLDDVTELQRITEQLRQKSEDQYTFDDWRALYFEATNRMELGEVDKYVEGMKRTAKDDSQKSTAKTGQAWLLLELKHYTEAIKLYDQIVEEYGTSDDLSLITRVAHALYNKGYTLGLQGQWEAEITVYDDVVSRYSARNEEDIVETVATALYNKGYTLGQQGQWEAEIAVYDDVVLRYSAHGEAGISELVAEALLNKGITLVQHDQWEAGITVYDDVVLRYGSRSEADIAEVVASALRNKGVVLRQQGQWEAAIAVYDDVVSRYGARNEESIAEVVTSALRNKGITLVQHDQWEAGITVYDDVVLRYGSRSEADIAAQVAKALLNKGIVLKQQGQWDATIAVYDELVSRYSTRSEAGIAAQVAKALYLRANALVKLDRTFEAKVAMASLIERYGSRTESKILKQVENAKKVLITLGNV